MTHRILLIDDDLGVRNVVMRCLEPAGYEVDAPPVEAEEASAATEEAALSGDYDLILLDPKLPHLDSLKLAEDLGTGPRPTPILVIAGFLPPNLRSHFGELGVTHFIEKPFQLSALRTGVRQAVRNSA